jgi:hypothetical protein
VYVTRLRLTLARGASSPAAATVFAAAPFTAFLPDTLLAVAATGFLAAFACLEVFALVAGVAGVAAKVLTGVANAAAMTMETATDRAVLRAAPWITFSDENMSVFMGVR